MAETVVGAPVARQVVMSTVPVPGDDAASCWIGLVASWHGDRVNYFANTGCEGIDVGAATVTVEGPDGHQGTFGCREQQDTLLLGCSAREVEGSLHCGNRCGQTVLTVAHRLEVPANIRWPDLESTSCAVDGKVLSCAYPVEIDTIPVKNAWSFEGDDYICVTRALVKTPVGTATVEATADAVRGVLRATGGMAEVAGDDLPGECADDATGT